MQRPNLEKVSDQSIYLRDAYNDLKHAYFQIGLASTMWEEELTRHLKKQKPKGVCSKADIEGVHAHVRYLRDTVKQLSDHMTALKQELKAEASEELSSV